MTENFITNIFVENSRNVKNLDIPLSKENRQHLIITGKNGSGKTSLLQEIHKFLKHFEVKNKFAALLRLKNDKKGMEELLLQTHLSDIQRKETEKVLNNAKESLLQLGGTNIDFSSYGNIIEKNEKGEFLFVFFNAKRNFNLRKPTGIQKFELQKKYDVGTQINQNFIQYIVNLKAKRSFAKDDNEYDVVQKIDNWFLNFENRLKDIFDVNKLELRFDKDNFNFDIITDKYEPFTFSHLSDGYSAIMSIVTELLLRMEAHENKFYDMEGVVIIDEIETHLHVDLQKKILPFLVDFFPKIQFIVSTHSPFVLSSVSNATICDLETRIVTTDLTSYSYDALLESYFKTDKYSEIVKSKVQEFENLVLISEKTPEQREKLRYLKEYFAHAPKYLSKELLVKLQQIELLELY